MNARIKHALPPIGCNGRGVQDSSLERPISIEEPAIEEQFRLVKAAGVFDGLDRLPMPNEVELFQRCSKQYDLPIYTASWFYALGEDESILQEKLALAAQVGAKQHNIMLYWHDVNGREITDEEVAAFYLRAYAIGMPMDVEPTMELHVNMWSEDPRRVASVAQLVRKQGVEFNFTLDYSHILFKIGNEQELRVCGIYDDVQAGRLELDPRLPGNLVEQWLEMGIVRWLQVRAAAPNGPRNVWSTIDLSREVAAIPQYSIFPYEDGMPGRGIIYPFTEPAPGEWHSAWDESQLDCIKQVVQLVLEHHAFNEQSRLRAITTEMITLPDYAHNAKFSLIGQNAAVAQFIRATWRALLEEPLERSSAQEQGAVQV